MPPMSSGFLLLVAGPAVCGCTRVAPGIVVAGMCAGACATVDPEIRVAPIAALAGTPGTSTGKGTGVATDAPANGAAGLTPGETATPPLGVRGGGTADTCNFG